MKEYVYYVELSAVKELRVRANSKREADNMVDLITTTETIPVKQEDIVDIMITDDLNDFGEDDDDVV